MTHFDIYACSKFQERVFPEEQTKRLRQAGHLSKKLGVVWGCGVGGGEEDNRSGVGVGREKTKKTIKTHGNIESTVLQLSW